ncbi:MULTISPECIES: type II secretion system major pseudopilin GspG [unclassified Bradyrhizobium]|uniref:type II secretion system major pseudopilin GspG n=1 Tax=unclassified Bradyrhizobium TaxID=2631580 RepID=UPI0028E3DCCA|nr:MULTISPECIES: type II secretion system major pseudopilin GspG [unclassified Bradyrhizobium]
MLGWMECRDAVKLRVAAWRGQFRLRLRRDRDGEAGFTLVEMLVVITIIGLIMGLVGPRVLSYLSDSKLKTARIQIRSLSSALDLYHLDNGRYPTAAEGLGALVQKPATATTWNGPYLSGTLVPNDPWGRPYVYKFPGQHGAYDIVSLGPEGREDDTSANANVTSWQP